MRFPAAIALAPAKLNLGLEVLGRRGDGYHELVTILQTVSNFDRFEWYDDGGPFKYQSPPGVAPHSDLVTTVLATRTGEWAGRLTIAKAIPLAAGLGGGSADAALALAVARPELNLGRLESMASELGSDVPFLIRGGTALASGTGTTFSKLPSLDAWFVIVTPPVAIPSKTASLYASLTSADFTDGEAVRSVARAIATGAWPGDVFPNAFARLLRRYPGIDAAWHALEMAAGRPVNVAGAGPSLYSIMPSYQIAAAVARRVPPGAGLVSIARTVPACSQANAIRALAMRVRGPRARVDAAFTDCLE